MKIKKIIALGVTAIVSFSIYKVVSTAYESYGSERYSMKLACIITYGDDILKVASATVYDYINDESRSNVSIDTEYGYASAKYRTGIFDLLNDQTSPISMTSDSEWSWKLTITEIESGIKQLKEGGLFSGWNFIGTIKHKGYDEYPFSMACNRKGAKYIHEKKSWFDETYPRFR